MKKLLTLLVPSIGIAGAIVTEGTTSSAGIVPMAGIAQNPAESGCFSNGNGTITNNCSGTRRFCLAVEMMSTGNKTFDATAYRPNGGTVQCQAVSVDRYGGTISNTGFIPLNVVNIDTPFTLGTVYIVGSGAAYICCDLSTGARLDGFNMPT